jgi:hypothetical protein
MRQGCDAALSTRHSFSHPTRLSKTPGRRSRLRDQAARKTEEIVRTSRSSSTSCAICAECYSDRRPSSPRRALGMGALSRDLPRSEYLNGIKRPRSLTRTRQKLFNTTTGSSCDRAGLASSPQYDRRRGLILASTTGLILASASVRFSLPQTKFISLHSVDDGTFHVPVESLAD